ncbi:hypothetical protein EIK77_010317 [Talaromyces pinophilus]|nr:hypothetical protein EIK77_010317 [Talaromyces pinophilus]
MSSDSSEYGLHVRKQRQQQEQEEQERVVNNTQNRIQQDASNESHQCETTGTKRPYPWPEPAVLQPRLESSTHARSIIGVQSILNPTEGGNSQVGKRIPQDSNNSNRNNNMTMELLRPPTLPPSPQRRSSSSPLLAPISKSSSAKSYLQHGGGSSVSPPHPPRRIITPVSPALRHASVGGNNNIGTGSVGATSNSGTGAGKVTVSQSPFVQELSAGVYSTPGHGRGASGPTATSIEYSSASRYSPKLAVSIPGRNPPPLQVPRHSTPTFHQHGRHLSGGLATNPSSQASSPSTPHSTFSSFAPSPSITSGILPPIGQSTSLPPSVDSASQSPYMGMDPLSRTPSRMSGSRYGDDPNSAVAYPGPTDLLSQAGNHVQYGSGPMIPVTIDLKSGSRSQAEKRKANSDASRRFRNRKKNEAALEQRISQLNEQLRFLTEERDFYRNERDFFRDTLGEHIGVAQMPPRPASPAPRRYTQSTASSGDQLSPADSHQAIGMGGEMMSKTMSTGTSSSLASATPRMLPTPASGSDALSYGSSAAGQQHPESWQSVNPPAGNYQHHPYREDVRYMSNMR